MSSLAPTYKRMVAPLCLIGLSLFPAIIIQQGVFGILAYPLWLIYHAPPFVYRDKPWYITRLGAFVTALVWAVVIYYITVLVSKGRKTNAHPQSLTKR